MADAFAEGFDQLPTMYSDRDDFRYLVSTGRLVRAAVIVGQLVADGSIVLFGTDIDASQV
ncbi:MAG: hypothetical protein ABIQ73_08050 [Acidimicrobiales bacterium]